MKPYLFALTIFFTPILAFSQSNAKLKKIEDLIQMMGTSKMFDQLKSAMSSSLREQFSGTDSEFQQIVDKSMNTDSLLKKVAVIYDKYYSEEDIDNLVKFYNSPTGKKTIENLPKIMQESMAAGQTWGMGSQKKLMEMLNDSTYKKQ